MAEKDKLTFPMLPPAHWWSLREKFKQSIPGTVTASYLSTVLDMQENSARSNVLPFLVRLGIVDEDGKTGDIARRWRDDVEYPEVCGEILSSVYPAELIDAVPTPWENREPAERWFATKTGAGSAAVGRMANLFAVIANGDPSGATTKKKKAKAEPKKKKATSKATGNPSATIKKTKESPPSTPALPGININLEVHISSDATPDQIDKIFESMAKHIYQK